MSLKKVLEDRYGVGPLAASPTTVVWAADHYARTAGVSKARAELSSLNRQREKAGKAPGVPSYGTALFGKRNPAVDAAQYRLAQAVAHGTARTKTSMTKKAAQEIIRKTPAKLRSEFMRHNPSKKMYVTSAEAKKLGLPSNEEQIDRYNKLIAKIKKEDAEKSRKRNAGKNSRRKFKKAARKRLGLHKRRNPEDAAIRAYEDTHGKLPQHDTFVETKLSYHKNLAGMGRLVELEICPVRGGLVMLKGFGKDCMLALNEAQTQLFIVGGDQSVDLKAFGLTGTHEKEVLGTCKSVTYHTEKLHLISKDGGKGFYQHKFDTPRPFIVYDSRNKLLSFAGGGYSIPAEGIKG